MTRDERAGLVTLLGMLTALAAIAMFYIYGLTLNLGADAAQPWLGRGQALTGLAILLLLGSVPLHALARRDPAATVAAAAD